MNINRLFAAMALMPVAAQAQTVPAIDRTAAASMEISMENPPVRLNDKELEALKLVREWKKNPDKPRRTDDGSVKYLFGATLPTLICTPLQVCAIRLQEGEKVNNVSIGDSTRWKITPSVFGSGKAETTLAIVKPTESGLTTSVIITTDRRKYTIKLVSARHEWMPELSFFYPEDAEQAWEGYKARQERHEYANTLPTGESLDDLDFGFRITGDSPKWKPIRVYAKGGKTYIQFSSSKFVDEAPALVALDGGGLFSDPSEQIVNYRSKGDKYVVDMVLKRAALIMGVGSDQVRVEIERAEEVK